MARQSKPTDAELDLLKVLWDNGPCTVAQVQAFLKDDPPRGYTTILKLMQIMTEKGLVKRDEKKKAHVYRAAITNKQAHHRYLRHLLDKAFDNSTSKLVAHALSARPVSAGELAEIRRLLDELEEKSK